MDYYEKLKANTDIISIAQALGYNGTKAGNCYQGDCPKHRSESGKCLVIWPDIQGFHCYHCHQKGDVIDLVELYNSCSHVDAVNYLAKHAGMAPLAAKSNDENRDDHDGEMRVLVQKMLTDAAVWYHAKLQHYPKIEKHLENHYGFSTDIIEELKIGFAPPTAGHSELAAQLFLTYGDKLALTGLFNYSDTKGPYYDYFQGRIVFPYWKQGKATYMIGRATALTPVNQYECYTDRNGDIKKDAQGNPQFIKYRALPKKRDDVKLPFDHHLFMGEDAIRNAKEIIITEGAPDFVSAVDHGFAALSPVTTRFREEDHEYLAYLTRNAETIYIINDNEDNEAGRDGALATGTYLAARGKNVFLVELPKAEGVSKVDLNEYLKDHSAKELRGVMAEAKSVPDLLIERLPEDFVKAQPIIEKEITPLIIRIKNSIQKHYVEKMAAKTKTKVSTVEAELKAAVKGCSDQEEGNTKKKPDPEIVSAAKQLAADPTLFKKENRPDQQYRSCWGKKGNRDGFCFS